MLLHIYPNTLHNLGVYSFLIMSVQHRPAEIQAAKRILDCCKVTVFARSLPKFLFSILADLRPKRMCRRTTAIWSDDQILEDSHKRFGMANGSIHESKLENRSSNFGKSWWTSYISYTYLNMKRLLYFPFLPAPCNYLPEKRISSNTG